MKAFAFCRITLLAFLIALACLLAGCGADDDDDDDNEVNGWERSACAWVREEMDSEEGEFEPVEDIEDCIPLLPDESYREDLEAMLRLYLGLYEDQESVEKEVSCRPEGLWVLPIPSPPGVPCVPTWAIPVWVRLSGLEEQVEGGVCQDYSPDPDWPLSEIDAMLEFNHENTDHGAYKSVDDQSVMHWIFTRPQSGPIWTKVE